MASKLDLSRYIIGIILLIFYEIILAPRISISGYQADLALIFTIWIAIIHGWKNGLYFGFAAGFLTGVLNPTELGWSCLLLSATGYIVGAVSHKLEIDPMPIKGLILLIAAFAFNLLIIFFTRFELFLLNISFVLISAVFSAIYSAVLGLVLFYIIRYRYVLKDLI